MKVIANLDEDIVVLNTQNLAQSKIEFPGTWSQKEEYSLLWYFYKTIYRGGSHQVAIAACELSEKGNPKDKNDIYCQFSSEKVMFTWF